MSSNMDIGCDFELKECELSTSYFATNAAKLIDV